MLISVVIPVHRVAEHLAGCLDSVLGQPHAEVEVIAVDDASPDSSGALLDERARADARLQVVHLDASVGPGRARRIGVDAASGEYVWFVDGDDALADGALATVAQRVEQLCPDVLVVGYEDVYPSGDRWRSGGPHLPQAPPPGSADREVVTLPRWPVLLTGTMTSWSKVLRLTFLRGLGVPFGPGIHEDVPVSCAALLAAERIGVLPEVCYRYRRQRRRSFMATASERHFDIFASYAWVFDFVEARAAAGTPIDATVRTALFERAIWHYTTILDAGLVPCGARREFFHSMSADYRRRRPPGYQPPGGARGVKFRLVERNAYRTYAALTPLNEVRVALNGGRAALRHRGV